MYWLILITLSAHPQSRYLHDRVDVTELHHNERGQFVTHYLIFWNLYPDGRYHVVDSRKYRGQVILYDWQQRHYSLQWHDEKNYRLLREVVSLTFMETWHHIDPEVADRYFIHQDQRRGLSSYHATPGPLLNSLTHLPY